MSDSMPQNPASPGRAGRYIQQPTGYQAFCPKPLPPDPPVVIGPEMQVLLSQADRALGRLDGSIQTLPHPDMFVYMYVRKEAVLSSQIEGTQSSLQDVLAAEARILAPDRPQDVDEVVNYVRAMNYGLQRLSELPVSVRLIVNLRESHRMAVTEQFGRAAGNGHRVLEHLYEHPIVSVSEVRDLIGTTHQAANEWVSKFMDNRILEEITGQARNRKFMYQSYINLFLDDTGVADA
jgi:hypothetical protein